MKTNLVLVPVSIEALDKSGFHVFVNLKVNGKRCRFLIDTGASHSVISKQYFEKIVGAKKLKTVKQSTTGLHSSTVESYFGNVAELTVGKLSIRKITLAAIDLTHVNNTYAQLKKKKISGIIGSDILLKYKAILNYGTSCMAMQK